MIRANRSKTLSLLLAMSVVISSTCPLYARVSQQSANDSSSASSSQSNETGKQLSADEQEQTVQSSSQEIDQPAGKKISQSTSQEIDQPAGKKIAQSKSQEIAQPAGKKISQSTSQEIARSAYQEIAQDAPQLRGGAQTGDSLEVIDRQILKAEIEILKLNAEFRTHYTKGVKWKKRRQKLYDAAAGGVANAGDICLISQFWKYWRNPGAGLAHKGRLQSGAVIVLVAYLMLGGMYAGEGVYDLACDYKAKRKGFDARSIYNRALALKVQLDKLFEQRNAALASSSLSSEQRAYLAAEDKVLKDVRDLSLIEFSRLYVDSRKQRVARDLTTLGTIAVCATGAFPGAYNVIIGLKDVNIKEVGGGGIGFLISGATLTAAPVLIHGGAAISGKISSVKLEKNLCQSQSKTLAALESDVAEMGRLRLANDPEQAESCRQLSLVAKLLSERHDYLEREKQRQRRQIIEDFIAYGAKGGPQIGWGTVLTHGGYTYNSNPFRAFRAVAQGATVNEVSWGIWLFDVLQSSVRGEISNYKNGKISPQEEVFSTVNAKLVDLEGGAHGAH